MKKRKTRKVTFPNGLKLTEEGNCYYHWIECKTSDVDFFQFVKIPSFKIHSKKRLTIENIGIDFILWSDEETNSYYIVETITGLTVYTHEIGDNFYTYNETEVWEYYLEKCQSSNLKTVLGNIQRVVEKNFQVSPRFVDKRESNQLKIPFL